MVHMVHNYNFANVYIALNVDHLRFLNCPHASTKQGKWSTIKIILLILLFMYQIMLQLQYFRDNLSTAAQQDRKRS
jgi:hypothetical protein